LEWYNSWTAAFKWEIFSYFSWNVSDIFDPITKETTHLRLNPFVGAYGYLDGAFTWAFSDNWWVSVSAYIQPFTAHVIDFDFWRVVNYPEWWTP
jgi:hypothetical protein